MFCKVFLYVGLILIILFPVPSRSTEDENRTYDLRVLPTEQRSLKDPETGADLLFLTTSPARDTNLYFHERSWLSDESMILFYSDRPDGGLMGFLTETGELVQFTTSEGPMGRATAMLKSPGVYAVRNNKVLQIQVRVRISPDPETTPSTVTITEKVICTLPQATHYTSLNENCEGKRLSIGAQGGEVGDTPAIFVIDIESGKLSELCRIDPSIGYGGHVQWSHTNPNLLSFAGRSERLMLVDVREGKPFNPYPAGEGEFITHESWWVNNQMLFCGGTHPEPINNQHVKVLDLSTGIVRIVGAGAWWPTGTDEEVAKLNWWHAAGSDDGNWVAGDNWHGDIMLFEGKTTLPHLLTVGHRHYGHGEHPHVGWDRTGDQVIFTSHKLRNPDVCVATIPENWGKRPSKHTR